MLLSYEPMPLVAGTPLEQTRSPVRIAGGSPFEGILIAAIPSVLLWSLIVSVIG